MDQVDRYSPFLHDLFSFRVLFSVFKDLQVAFHLVCYIFRCAFV